ncbi:cell division protein FtsX [Bacteroidota bacterium]|nr:cell division protein FtsX [Bacteroidota bacterium]
MATSKNKSRRRFKPSHIYSIISTALVLFVAGILFLILLHGSKMSDYLKENISFTLILKDNVTEETGKKLQEELSSKPYIKSADYISKTQAQDIYIEEFGDDYRDMLEGNPLFASIDIKMNANFTQPDSVMAIQNRLQANPAVQEFYYESKLIELSNKNFKTFSFIIIVLSLLLGFVAFTLIDSTIRLAMYSQRFLLRSMQLVGATNSFIRRPFLLKGLINGFISGLIAVALLITLLNVMLNILPDLKALQDFNLTILLFIGIVFLGILFTITSSFIVVNKYLRMHLDELY